MTSFLAANEVKGGHPAYVAFMAEVASIPVEHRQAISSALRTMGHAIFEVDRDRAYGLLDASNMVRPR